MPWIFVYESNGKVCSMASVNETEYKRTKLAKYYPDIKVLVDRTGVPDEVYEKVYGLVLELASKINKGENIDLEGELERLLSEV